MPGGNAASVWLSVFGFGMAWPAMGSKEHLIVSTDRQNGNALRYCSGELQNDLKIRTIATVRKNGQALKDAPEEMKGDRERYPGRDGPPMGLGEDEG